VTWESDSASTDATALAIKGASAGARQEKNMEILHWFDSTKLLLERLERINIERTASTV
jgi:hypothetical protein